MRIKAIETRYGGCLFRSRLEARWACFFDELGIAWEYEPQGFILGDRAYLPDFLLTECDTWVEVKGSESQLDHDLMIAAAQHLPGPPLANDRGPRLLILGPIPKPPGYGDLGWMGLDSVQHDGDAVIIDRWWGFSHYRKDHRPHTLTNTSCPTSYNDEGPWLTPALDSTESDPDALRAYESARSARFEHGQRGRIL